MTRDIKEIVDHIIAGGTASPNEVSHLYAQLANSDKAFIDALIIRLLLGNSTR